jgi:hypothetical protein
MVNQRDNDYKTAKNNIVFNELQQLTPQQIVDSGNLFDKFQYTDKLTQQQQAWLTDARGNAQQTLRTQALNELSPEEIADAATIGNIKLAPEYGSFSSQDIKSFSTLQDKYRADLDSKNYSLATQLLNSIPNPLDRARLVANPPEFKAMLEQSGIKFRKGETFTQLMSDLGATYNDPNKKAELSRIDDDRLTSQLADASESGKSLSEVYSIIDNAVNYQGNHLTEQQKAEKLNYVLDNSDYIQKFVAKESINTKKYPSLQQELKDINNPKLTAISRASAADKLKAYGEKLFENFPLHMRKVLLKKYESHIDSLLKTSNESAKVQTEMDKNTARNEIQKMLNAEGTNGERMDFKDILDGEYKSKISAKDNNKANKIKGSILDMLQSNVSLEKYGPLITYLQKNPNSSFSSYVFDSFYNLNEADRKHPEADYMHKGENMNKITSKLDRLMKILPHIKTLEQSNIVYNGK